MVRDVLIDFKIELDRLIFEIQPLAKRLYDLMKELPNPGDEVKIGYDKFDLIIQDKE